jgi:hypothetical protein
MAASSALVPEPTAAAESIAAGAAEHRWPPLSSGIVAPSTAVITRFDREKLFLYGTAFFAIALVIAFYLFGYLFPALSYGRAIVDAAQGDPNLPRGCYLQWLEHANRLQSAYSIRFLGMMIGTVIAFIGMVFTIKGMEAGYSLDLSSGSTAASLKTASPGLVLCTLGIALCAAATLHTMDLSFQMSTSCLELRSR